MFRKYGSKYPKVGVKWYASAQSADREVDGVTKEISTRQAYISCSNPFRLNERVDIVIFTPDRELRVKAEVVWSNIYGHDDDITPRGMGVHFLNISNSDKEFVAEIIKKHCVTKIASDYLAAISGEEDQK